MVENIKAFAADNMVGFSLADIPIFLFQVLYAGLIAFVMVKLFPGNKEDRKLVRYVTLAIILAGVTGMVKHSLALSVLAVGMLLAMRFSSLSKHFDNTLLLLVIMAMAITCGAGLAIPATMVGGLVLITSWISGTTRGK